MLFWAAIYVFTVIYIVLSRINYHFELEWMEGGSLLQVIRILSGKALYVKPTLEYIPYIYPPLYFYISSFFALFMGVSFLPLRMVSFLSSIGCMVLIFLFVRRETRNYFSGFMAVGLFAATFHLSGAWFDIARVDSLFLFFLLWAAFIIYDLDLKKSIFAGILISCALFTKQTGIIAIAPFLMYVLINNWKNFFNLAFVTLLLTGGISLAWDIFSQGWFKYYIFDLPRNHIGSINLGSGLIYKLHEIVKPTGLAIIMGTFFLSKMVRIPFSKKISEYNRLLFYFLISSGLLGISVVGMLNPGGYPNVLLPAYACIAILFGLGLSEAFKITQLNKAYFMNIVLLFLVMYQFYELKFPISSQIPTMQDRLAGNLMVTTIKNSKGEVFIPSSNYLAYFSGKNTYLNTMSLWEINGYFGLPDNEISLSLMRDIQKAIDERKFSSIIIDNNETLDPKQLDTKYIPAKKLFNDPNEFIPVTGWDNRPDTLYIPAP
jgi:hypothetical protein